MILISHRGNVSGKIVELENKPDYLNSCFDKGFDVETDIRLVENELLLGHDQPIHKVELSWLDERKNKMWLHCKNLEAFEFFREKDFNIFWHDVDDYTLTSKGFIWTYPGKKLSKGSIAVLPEKWTEEKILNCAGVCSDFIERFIHQ
jgi:hypothetical protein